MMATGTLARLVNLLYSRLRCFSTLFSVGRQLSLATSEVPWGQVGVIVGPNPKRVGDIHARHDGDEDQLCLVAKKCPAVRRLVDNAEGEESAVVPLAADLNSSKMSLQSWLLMLICTAGWSRSLLLVKLQSVHRCYWSGDSMSLVIRNLYARVIV